RSARRLEPAIRAALAGRRRVSAVGRNAANGPPERSAGGRQRRRCSGRAARRRQTRTRSVRHLESATARRENTPTRLLEEHYGTDNQRQSCRAGGRTEGSVGQVHVQPDRVFYFKVQQMGV